MSECGNSAKSTARPKRRWQYQRFETGKQKPGSDSLLSLADHFGVSLDYLAGRSDRREM